MPMGISAIDNPDTLDRVVKLSKQGKTDLEIAKLLNLTKNTVARCRLKRGLRKIRNVSGR